MASHMVVPPSRDTLFIRGFTGRRDIQDIREYFERQAGCDVTIEFFKQSELDDTLYVALKFESREIAKDMLNRFDDTEVLGDRVEMTWFKDLRKAKTQAAFDRQQRYGGRMDYNHYGRYNRRRMSPVNRGRYNRDRSYSRSASRSRSRSKSASRGRSRDKRNRASSSRSPSSSPEPPPPKSSSKLRSEVKSKKKSSDADDDQQEQKDAQSPAKKQTSVQEDTKPPNSPDDRSPSRQTSRSRDVKPSPKVKRDVSEERKVSRVSVEEQRAPKRGVDEDRFSRMSDDSVTRNQEESRVSHVGDNVKQSRLADDMKFTQMSDEPVRQSEMGPQGSTRSLQLEQRQLEQQRLLRRQELEREDMARFGSKVSTMRHDPILDSQDLVERRRGMRGFSPDMQLDAQDRAYGVKTEDDRTRGRGFDGPASTMFWDELDDPRKSKAFLTKERLGEPMREMRGTGDRTGQSVRHLDSDEPLLRDRALGMRMVDDDDRWGYGSDMMQRRAQMSRQARDMDFSQDAMALVQDKKKEIERIYKNDCETFVTVVKMIISKDPSLEEKMQFTLRENLKEIGQRCILDLREYMDRLREHDSIPMKIA